MINILDIETFEEKNEVIPYCVCLSLWEKKHSVYYTKNLIVEVINIIVNETNEKFTEIFIHNLNFDGMIIIKWLAKNFIPFELVSNKANIYKITIKYCNKLISLKCSYKLIPLSLKKLGEIEGFEKKYFPHRFVGKERLNYIGEIPSKDYWEKGDYEKYLTQGERVFDLKKESIEYCMNDVVLTGRVLKNLFAIIDAEDNNIRKKCLSAPSMSFKLFYKRYNKFGIEKRIRLEEEGYVRKSYYGGRCEVFGNPYSGEIVKYFDYSGMYAQCMMELFHVGFGEFVAPKNFQKPGFYNIDYISEHPFLPVLPSHYNQKLMFANGKNNGTFWFEEIKLFEEMGGRVLSINNALVYESFQPVFEKFVLKFNNIRQKGGYYKIFAKLMINSLYGRMGLQEKNTLQYITFSEEEFFNIYKNTTVTNFYQINECYLIVIEDDYKAKHFFKRKGNEISKEGIYDYPHSNVSYAAAITAKARIKIYKAMLCAIEEGGRLLYCDTDSVFASFSKNDLSKKTKLFEWIDFYEDAVFIAPKTYGLKKGNDIVRIKGISTKEINFAELKEKFYNEDEIVFKDQLNFRKADFNLKQFYIEKKVSISKYDKRLFSPDKKSTTPLSV